MDKDISSLLKLYDREIEVYGNMLDSGREKKEILKKKDMKKLSSLVNKEARLLDMAGQLEKVRRSIYKKILPEKQTTKKWLKTLPAGIRASIEKKRNKLLKIISELNKINDINAALISQSIDLIEYTLKTLTQIKDKTSAYDAGGNPYGKKKVVESTIFDRKL